MTESKKKLIPIGIDDFKELIEANYYFVDKSLFIKEFLDSSAKVTLIPRPRRFGKTLNMSMLRHFFEKKEVSLRYLFNGLAIEQYPDCMEHQGKYPVIWLTFKDVKAERWELCYEKICSLIGDEYKRHFPRLQSILTDIELVSVEKIMAGTASQTLYENALLDLSRYLERAYGAQVVILIDEYDAPVHAGYLKGYYQEIIGLMRGFLGAGLKGNSAMNLSALTGILRVAKESIFSGLNNLDVCSLVTKRYDDCFGFLETEIKTMLTYFEMGNQFDEVRRWYDGYQSGSCKIYNPWSIINLVKNRGMIQPYWINTSDNALIKDLLLKSSPEVKEDFEVLIKGGKVTKPIQENIAMPDIDRNENVLWNFLLFCGYLTFEDFRREEDVWFADLFIPNAEVISSYKISFQNWFLETTHARFYTKMLESLVAGEIEPFQDYFVRFTRDTLSYFDVRGDEPERFYHALVLGMLASLSSTHEVRSNRESGYGRYDVMVIPKNLNKPGIVLEFKNVNEQRGETLELAAESALKQINEKNYEAELRARGITKILTLGISFKGKESLVLVGS